MSATANCGGPGTSKAGNKHCALMVVPCGMEAIRDNVSLMTGLFVVAGTCIQSPGSKCMPAAGLLARPDTTAKYLVSLRSS